MTYPACLLLMILVVASAANAEPVSIRCADEFDKQPYFVTYDLETKHVVFESTVGNLLGGEILVASDERIDISLSVVGGKLLLFFDRQKNRMGWPGLPAHELRAPLNHACLPSPSRTMLSLFSRPDKIDLNRRLPVDVFSIRCPGVGQYRFLTMDRKTKTVVSETEGLDRRLSGDITSITDREVAFTLGSNPSELYELVWDQQSQTLTVIGVPGNPARPTKTDQCAEIPVRSIMEIYPHVTKWK
jgi:hypothetical protein